MYLQTILVPKPIHILTLSSYLIYNKITTIAKYKCNNTIKGKNIIDVHYNKSVGDSVPTMIIMHGPDLAIPGVGQHCGVTKINQHYIHKLVAIVNYQIGCPQLLIWVL